MAGMNVEEKQGMCRFILDVNEQCRHDDRPDRARHGRRDGHLMTCGGAGLMQQKIGDGDPDAVRGITRRSSMLPGRRPLN